MRGFSILELAIVLLIIGIIASFGIPVFLRQSETKGERFINALNVISSLAAQQAIKNGTGVEINLNLRAKTVSLISGKDTIRKIEMPAEIDVQDFYIDGKNQFDISGGERYSAYFYINSSGIAQEVRITFTDKLAKKLYDIEINPFTVKFGLR